jgi:dUTP pyrophosphatase
MWKGARVMNDLRIMFVKAHKDAVIPKYARPGDAACDLCSIEDVTIGPSERALIGTGLKIAVPYGFEAQIRPRSGNAWKRGLTVINTPGTIDAGYRGEVKVALINLSRTTATILKGDAIAQMKFSAVYTGHFIETDVLDDSERGAGGFGHTDND